METSPKCFKTLFKSIIRFNFELNSILFKYPSQPLLGEPHFHKTVFQPYKMCQGAYDVSQSSQSCTEGCIFSNWTPCLSYLIFQPLNRTQFTHLLLSFFLSLTIAVLQSVVYEILGETRCRFCVTTPLQIGLGRRLSPPRHHHLLPQSWPEILQQMIVANFIFGYTYLILCNLPTIYTLVAQKQLR